MGMTREEVLEKAISEACDLLAERTYGNSARSPGHNARLRLEQALVASVYTEAHAQDGNGKTAGADYIVKTINILREEEGDSVTILCDNPDGPPNCAIECNGSWTGWEDKRFVGADLIEALSAAYLQCIQLRAAADYGKKWSGTAPRTPAEGVSASDISSKLAEFFCGKQALRDQAAKAILAMFRTPHTSTVGGGL